MKKISRKNIPSGMGLNTMITTWLLLDRLAVTDLIWGIYWTICGVMVLSFIIVEATTEVIDLFEKD